MSKNKFFLMLILASMLFACKQPVPEPAPDPTLSVEPAGKTIQFAVEGETKTFTVTTNQESWTVNSNSEWLVAAQTETGFTLTAAANEAPTARPAATVTVIAPGCGIVSFTATQAGVVVNILPEDYMVLVEAGSFLMGAPDDVEENDYGAPNARPQHQVTITKNYYIAKYEVTKELWALVMGEDEQSNPNRPISSVSYYEVIGFLANLNSMTGKNYRLPTEAEWEFAARGGNSTHGYLYPGSENPAEVSYNGDTQNWNVWSPTDIGTLAANELGLYDMSGNVAEWVADWHVAYPADAQTDPKGPVGGTERVVRGGAYDINNFGSRVYTRTSFGPSIKSQNRGFRIALSAE
jgi:formylglycine-generating enzyme required for sulfatase activity